MTESYRVEMTHISKSFGGVLALDDVEFNVRPGEIHALVGENGAGKSTLMNILSGAILKDTGEIKLDGRTVAIKNPHTARKLGIGTIYQEFTLVPDLTVAENVYLHHLGSKRGLMNWPELFQRTRKLTDSLGFDIDPKIEAGKLSVAYQQVVEISKALSEDVKLLILDEPTAVLAISEARRLFDVIRKLKDQNVSIIYISHRLEEIFRIADKITVLKDGKNAGTKPAADTTTEETIQMMIGRRLATMFPERKCETGDELLRVENVSRGKAVNDVSFSVKAGEVVGLAGLVGSGRTETLRAIFAADKIDNGRVYIENVNQKISSPKKAVNSGLALVPEDRKNHGVILSMSVKENVSMTGIESISSGPGIISQNKESSMVEKLIQKLRIKTESPETLVGNLSGGNQQKVVLAKWFGSRYKIILLDEPTRGVDIGTKHEIYQLINELAEEGLGIVLVSSEIGEITGMCDRAIVMKEGRIAGTLERGELTEENIFKLSIGGEN